MRALTLALPPDFLPIKTVDATVLSEFDERNNSIPFEDWDDDCLLNRYDVECSARVFVRAITS